MEVLKKRKNQVRLHSELIHKAKGAEAPYTVYLRHEVDMCFSVSKRVRP